MSKALGLIAITGILAGCASVQSDPNEAAALAGDPIALNHLCYGYIYGRLGYAKDYDHALIWCKKGAATGDSNDETLYAEMYYEGDGVKKDKSLAHFWYKRAAEQGHTHAQYMLAVAELESDKPNGQAICYWLSRSREQNYDNARKLWDILQDRWSKSHPDGTPLCSEADMDGPEPP